MISRFFRGMGYFGRGWRVAFGEGALTPWVLLPALLTIVVSGGGAWLTWRWAAELVHRHAAGHGAVWAALAWVAVALLVLGTAYVLYVASCLLTTAPFAGLLSEGAERVATGQRVTEAGWGEMASQAARGVWHSVLAVACYVAIAVPLFVLHWLAPPLGPIVWVLGVVQTALFFAFDGFNEPLHRRGAGFGDKWRFIGAHLAESLGFGVGVALLMMVPFLSVVVTPVAVVGGTLLYLDLAKGAGTAAG